MNIGMHTVLKQDFDLIRGFIKDKESLRGAHWLITGVTGMICSYFTAFLCRLNEEDLGSSMRITAIHRKDLDRSHPNVGFLVDKEYISFRKADLSMPFRLEQGDRFDFIVHGASNAAPRDYLADPVGTINTNVRATQMLLDHCRDMQGLRNFLFFSSGEIYGEVARDDVPTPETYTGLVDHLSPRACYVEAKRFAETLCRFYHSQYGIPVTMIRPIHAFGPGFREHDSRVWADFIVSASRRRTIEILSDGKAERGFCYLADAVTQIMAVLLRGAAGEVYNIGSDELTSILRLASVVAAVAGDDVTIDVKNRLPSYLQQSPHLSCPSIEKVRRLAPLLKTPLEEGVKRSYEWFNALSAGGPETA